MKLREIAIHTTYKHPLSVFNAQTWCVREQYWSYLKNYDTGQFAKVVVRVDNNPSLKKDDFTLQNTDSNVVVISKYFDISAFLTLNDINKKKALLELLHASMLCLAQQYNWYKEPLVDAYEKCKHANLEYRFKVKDKEYKSPDKKFIGCVECYWDLEHFTATGIIKGKDSNIVKEEVLMDIVPYNGEFIYYSNCKWDDPYTFSLYSKDKQKWSVKILSVA